METNTNTNTNPAFYKILMEIHPTLTIPEAFVEKHGDTLPIPKGLVKLRNALGGTWEVMFEKSAEDDSYGFTTGWAEFCRDVGVDVFELLIFSYAGVAAAAAFDVSVYAVTTLEKQLHHAPPIQNPRYRTTLQHYTIRKLHFPSNFAAEAGLPAKRRIRLQYCAGGPSGEANLNTCNGRAALGSGWTQFRKKSGLTIGKDYTFEFVPQENVIRVWPHPSHL